MISRELQRCLTAHRLSDEVCFFDSQRSHERLNVLRQEGEPRILDHGFIRFTELGHVEEDDAVMFCKLVNVTFKIAPSGSAGPGAMNAD